MPRSESIRRVLGHPLVETQVSRGLRARCVRESTRFFARDARGRGRYVYTARATGTRLTLEHGTSDIAAFDQAFYQGVHAPSAAAAARLRELDRPLRVADLGANIGMFSIWLGGHFPLAHVTAVEPLPRNVRALRRNLELLLPAAASSTVVEAAAGTREGTVRFGGGDPATGRVQEDGAPGAVEVRLVDAFPLIDSADVVKLDIEGSEWPILADPRFARLAAPVVMLEHHPGPGVADPASAAEAALAAAGYRAERTIGEADGTGVLWGVR